jgi:ABC-type uncharacterized transport system permease subunit
MVFDAVTIGLLLASAIRLGAPLLLASLGELISERTGILNIGLEGIMLFGAFGAVLGLQMTGSPYLALACGVLWGVGAAGILAVAVAILRADQIVVGIGFNILAIGATSLLRELALKPNFRRPRCALSRPTASPTFPKFQSSDVRSSHKARSFTGRSSSPSSSGYFSASPAKAWSFARWERRRRRPMPPGYR